MDGEIDRDTQREREREEEAVSCLGTPEIPFLTTKQKQSGVGEGHMRLRPATKRKEG
jgi:hypothetical protein